MATVWKLKLKSGLIRWRADYVDGGGKRRFKQFVRKMDAEAWLVETSHDVVRGLHTPASVSPTVKEAGELWLKRCHDKALEPMTTKGYEEHCKLHIYPFIGSKKLADLTVPAVNAFADQLRDAGRSRRNDPTRRPLSRRNFPRGPPPWSLECRSYRWP